MVETQSLYLTWAWIGTGSRWTDSITIAMLLHVKTGKECVVMSRQNVVVVVVVLVCWPVDESDDNVLDIHVLVQVCARGQETVQRLQMVLIRKHLHHIHTTLHPEERVYGILDISLAGKFKYIFIIFGTSRPENPLFSLYYNIPM